MNFAHPKEVWGGGTAAGRHLYTANKEHCRDGLPCVEFWADPAGAERAGEDPEDCLCYYKRRAAYRL